VCRVGQVECGRPSGKAEPIFVGAVDAETEKVPERGIANTRKPQAEVRRDVERNCSLAAGEGVSGLKTNRLVSKSVSTDSPECRRRR
jgi:hypothetical protein